MWVKGIPVKIHELAKLHRVENNDVQRTARKCGLDPKSSSSELSSSDVKLIEAYVGEHGWVTTVRRQQLRDTQTLVNEPSRELSLPNVPPAEGLRRGSKFRLVAHTDYLDWLTATHQSSPRVRQKARLLHEQMLARGEPVSRSKHTAGPNKGWNRSPLGGSNQNHFYLYWARKGQKVAEPFALATGDILLRAVRHHDQTDEALPPNGEVEPLVQNDAVAAADADDQPYTQAQRAVAAISAPIRVVQGNPGSGKTTTLYLRARMVTGQRIAYLTYSERLAADARLELDAHLAANSTAVVATFGQLFSHGGGATDDARLDLDAAWREGVGADKRKLGRWTGFSQLLHAELYAHVIGGVAEEVPVQDVSGAGEESAKRAYLARRCAAIGEELAADAWRIGSGLAEVFPTICPGPFRARELLRQPALIEACAQWLGDVDLILVDEVQDLTRAEMAALFRVIAVGAKLHGKLPELIVAGDEGQTVRPTDFAWGVLNDVITANLNRRPEGFELTGNLRSPRVIAALVNRSWHLYKEVKKGGRPAGQAATEAAEDGIGRVLHCRFAGDDESLDRFVKELAQRLNVQWVSPFSADTKTAGADAAVLTATQVKGLGFPIVAVLNAGGHLARIDQLEHDVSDRRDLGDAARRTQIDQFRVTISRATDTLVFVEAGTDAFNRRLLQFLAVDAEGADTAIVRSLTVDELREQLKEDYADPVERAERYMDAAKAFLPDRPEEAAKRLEWASSHLANAQDAEDPDAKRERTHRLAKLRALTEMLRAAQAKSSTARQAACNTAAEFARAAGDAEFAAFCSDCVKFDLPSTAHAAQALRAAVGRFDTVDLAFSAAGGSLPIDNFLLDAARRIARGDAPISKQEFAAIFDALEHIGMIARKHNHLAEFKQLRDGVVDRAVAAVVADARKADAKNFPRTRLDDALKWLRRRDKPNPSLSGDIHELLGQFNEAIGEFEAAGRSVDALRCARTVANVPKAVELANKMELQDVAAALGWVKDLTDLAGRPVQQLGGVLTEAEKQQVTQAVVAALARR